MNKILNKIYESAIVYKKIQLKQDVVLILNYLKTSSNRLKEKEKTSGFFLQDLPASRRSDMFFFCRGGHILRHHAHQLVGYVGFLQIRRFFLA